MLYSGKCCDIWWCLDYYLLFIFSQRFGIPAQRDARVRLYAKDIEGKRYIINSKRPYTHILKNLFHEQAEELIPLLLPGFLVEQVLDIEMPELRTIETDEQPSEMEQGLVGLVVPEAKLLSVIKTESAVVAR